jgi:tetratricopeptide (TPR) repeat protein
VPFASSLRKLALLFTGALLVAILVLLYLVTHRAPQPAPGTAAYEQASRAFYRGLAAMEVGLLDNARTEFTTATRLAPDEPAAWADLGLVQLRLGELDAAAAPIDRAMSIAPSNGALVLLAGRMEIARGRVDDGIALLRKAVALDPKSPRAQFALAEEVERAGGPNADREALQLQNDLLQLSNGNLAVLLERARLAARLSDSGVLADSVMRLRARAASWPAVVMGQLDALQRAADARDFAGAARTTVVLRNVLARVPAYTESLTAVRPPVELIAEPFDRFIRLTPASSTPDPADTAMTFERVAMTAPRGGASHVAVFPLTADETPVVGAFDGAMLQTMTGQTRSWPMPVSGAVSVDGMLPIDWNHDFRTDFVLAGSSGIHLFLQTDTGAFEDATARASAAGPVPSTPPIDAAAFGAWAADIEMDGDLDVVIGAADGPTLVLRNNGDGTWQPLSTFASVVSLRGFAWADLDGDGDPDAALLDRAGRVHVFLNRQAGAFESIDVPSDLRDVVAMTVADVNGDDGFDLVTMDAHGALRRASLQVDVTGVQPPAWAGQALASWDGAPAGLSSGSVRLLTGDLDNNGAIDLITSSGGRSRVWLAGDHYDFSAMSQSPAADVVAIVDTDGDGRLDLVGEASGAPVRIVTHGTRPYHWKSLRARAQQRAGDQRINAFGVGADIEVRSGLLVQKQLLSGLPAHFGLGTRASIDVARIVWPNGVPQAEFDMRVDDAIVAEQRLKGSCPWVFAYDGHGMQFVTDFLWRSPLGLRINAQDTAGVSQTEDWIRIAGDQLVPRDGVYDVRITAELWETHFFDHVSLMTVDHPDDTDVFVDERFSAAHPPALAVQALHVLRPVSQAIDDRGRDVTAIVATADGHDLTDFDLGEYQGIAREHWVEFALGDDIPRDGRARLLAHGWVYPTDSSINVAIGQGHAVHPGGVALEAQDAAGRWRVVNADLGFPAGKNKTMVIDLRGTEGARRLRLRTNLEVYWDSLSYAVAVDAPVRTARLAASTAELRYRGFSETVSPRGDTPETPLYDRLANTAPRWRDLTGYYTRFGDVRELLAGVDDRYVIMNAGDELRLEFPASSAPPEGWRRDYVLIGDGWEKDGDYNTGSSSTVLPLPTHASATYAGRSGPLVLEDDPVYRQHADDWTRFHTRFVTPAPFLRGLGAAR